MNILLLAHIFPDEHIEDTHSKEFEEINKRIDRLEKAVAKIIYEIRNNKEK